MIFNFSHTKDFQPSLKINDEELKVVSSSKILGIHHGCILLEYQVAGGGWQKNHLGGAEKWNFTHFPRIFQNFFIKMQ